MANVREYNQILAKIRNKEFAPFYLLHGEEPYYIDKLSKAIELNALEEHERDFNLNIFYGKDLNPDHLLEALRRFPMMAPFQVVIIREAQDYKGKWTDLEEYFNQPVPTTIFVIDHKYKKADERLKWVKAIGKKGVLFQSTTHYDNELPEVITHLTAGFKYRINAHASFMLAEYLGNDLEKIEMELQKLMITIPLSREITSEDIQKHIGISRAYSVFDYIDALIERKVARAYKIAQYLGQNEKLNPFVMTIGAVYNHFARLMMYHGLAQKDMKSVMALPSVRSPYTAKKLMNTAQQYNPRKTAEIITIMRDIDARYKGVNSNSTSPDRLLKELTYMILN